MGLLQDQFKSPVALVNILSGSSFFQSPYQLIFYHRIPSQFQIILKGTLQVTCPQPWYIYFSKNCYKRNLSHIYPLITVNIQLMSPQALSYHPQSYHTYQNQIIYLIKLALILHRPKICLCLNILVWFLSMHHHICLFWCQPQSLVENPFDHTLQDLHHQSSHLIKLSLLLHRPQVCIFI